ncbi:MAG TPA: oligogalacturonate lyase family protein, partial [Brevundimonas sp.]
PAAGAFAGAVQAQTAPVAPPGGPPVFPAPNTAPPIHQVGDTPPPWPTWDGPVPADWVDPATGHRVVRLSGDEGGNKLYFYRNSFTPQGDVLVFSSSEGIIKVELNNGFRRSVLVPDANADLMVTGRKTRTAYYTVTDAGEGQPSDRGRTLHAVDIDTGATRRIARLDQGSFSSINADETLCVGTVAYGDAPLQPNAADPRNRRAGQAEYAALGPDGRPLNFAKAKGVRMLQRWAARVPMELFVVDLRTGERRVLHSATDWLNHPQFSPTDPDRIIFSHEGPWHRVDRMWTIRTDGTDLRKLHQRTMNFEIFGHEWFSPDGKAVMYDLQTPRGQVYWVASVDLETGKRIYRRVEQNSWSVHYNTAPDGSLFAGDGGDADMVAHAPDGKWLVLLRPEPLIDGDPDSDQEAMISVEYLRTERLVDMSRHDYRLEPNVTFTPDGRWVLFVSNMHGRNHVYAAEVTRA